MTADRSVTESTMVRKRSIQVEAAMEMKQWLTFKDLAELVAAGNIAGVPWNAKVFIPHGMVTYLGSIAVEWEEKE